MQGVLVKRNTLASLVGISTITALAATWPFGLGAGPAPHAGTPPQSAAAAVTVRHTLTLDGANRVLAAAMAKAKERRAGGAIAVVDDGGNLIAFQRIDDTFAAGAAVSIGKARTAALFKKPTKAFEDEIGRAHA